MELRYITCFEMLPINRYIWSLVYRMIRSGYMGFMKPQTMSNPSKQNYKGLIFGNLSCIKETGSNETSWFHVFFRKKGAKCIRIT